MNTEHELNQKKIVAKLRQCFVNGTVGVEPDTPPSADVVPWCILPDTLQIEASEKSLYELGRGVKEMCEQSGRSFTEAAELIQRIVDEINMSVFIPNMSNMQVTVELYTKCDDVSWTTTTPPCNLFKAVPPDSMLENPEHIQKFENLWAKVKVECDGVSVYSMNESVPFQRVVKENEATYGVFNYDSFTMTVEPERLSIGFSDANIDKILRDCMYMLERHGATVDEDTCRPRTMTERERKVRYILTAIKCAMHSKYNDVEEVWNDLHGYDQRRHMELTLEALTELAGDRAIKNYEIQMYKVSNFGYEEPDDLDYFD